MSSRINTKFLVVSDTHGLGFKAEMIPREPVDVVIHCGDLTQHSRIDEFRATLGMLRELNAPLKLVIAGNHDFSLDLPAFQAKINEANRINKQALEQDLIDREFGRPGEVRKLLEDARTDGIILLDQGTYTFSLSNGTRLRVYASPCTPSSEIWGFSYSGKHDFELEPDTDIAITHGPPRGIMDMSRDGKRLGCPHLFAAVAKCQPRMHCFGHVHNGWGAKMVAWRPEISDPPSHFSDIDNDKSRMIANLKMLTITKSEHKAEGGEEDNNNSPRRTDRVFYADHYQSEEPDNNNNKTLFVNAAMEAHGELSQLPWVVNIDIPTCP